MATAAQLYITKGPDGADPDASMPSVELEWNADLQFLRRYFETANLEPWVSELVDVYADRVISGYQQKRLKDELSVAVLDASRRPGRWRELVGWTSNDRRVETEGWQVVDKAKLPAKIEALRRLIDGAVSCKGALVVSGD
ncbi:MAG: hypothetical protein U1F25_03930 [Rubrivivax sp.]